MKMLVLIQLRQFVGGVRVISELVDCQQNGEILVCLTAPQVKWSFLYPDWPE
jgi:hypothetical protein